MRAEHQTFVVFEQNRRARARAGVAPWPDTLEIPELSDGEGSFGTIYHLMVRDGAPADCCLKVFKSLVCQLPESADPLDIDEPASWKRAHDEYDKLCRLNGLDGHAPVGYAFGAIVQPARAGVHAMRPAFVMEDLSQGFRPLSTIGRPRTTADVAGFGLNLLETIRLLRSKQIVHADFSEGNVMVRLSSDGRSIEGVALVDFGQGKESTEAVTPTNEGFRLGTMPYAAPEILPLVDTGHAVPFAEDHARAFARRNKYTVDLWSLGAMLYLLRTGSKPPLSTRFSSERGCYVDANNHTVSQDRAFENIIGDKRRGLRLRLDASATRQDRKLSEAIELCTKARPEDRDLIRIEELLRQALEEDATPGTDVTPDMSSTVDTGSGGGAGGASDGASDDGADDAPGGDGADGDAAPDSAPGGDAGGDAAPDNAPGGRTITLDGSNTGAKPDTGAEPGTDSSSAGAGAVFAAVYQMFRASDGSPYSAQRQRNLLVLGGAPAVVEGVDWCSVHGVSFKLEQVGKTIDLRGGRRADPSAWADISYAAFGGRIAPVSTEGWFTGCADLREVFSIENLNTARVTSMRSMFEGCSELRKLDVSSLDAGNVRDATNLFAGCPVGDLPATRAWMAENLPSEGSGVEGPGGGTDTGEDLISDLAAAVAEAVRLERISAALEQLIAERSDGSEDAPDMLEELRRRIAELSGSVGAGSEDAGSEGAGAAGGSAGGHGGAGAELEGTPTSEQVAALHAQLTKVMFGHAEPAGPAGRRVAGELPSGAGAGSGDSLEELAAQVKAVAGSFGSGSGGAGGSGSGSDGAEDGAGDGASDAHEGSPSERKGLLRRLLDID